MTRVYIAGTASEVSGDGTGRLGGVLGRDGYLTGVLRVLESFYYVRDWQTDCIRDFRGFMLDSGAYTLCYGAKKTVDIPSYVDSYMRYVKDNDVELYFELDIDDVIGIGEVERYRRLIEGYVGRQCIPVWHEGRGHDGWLRMCDEYPYVAIGGIADKGRASIEPLIPRMVEEAHDRGVMVHGLGYARTSRLGEMGFDSIDSASWTWGLKRHYLFMWDGRSMSYNGFDRNSPVTAGDIQEHNITEWAAMSLDLEFGDGTASDVLGDYRVLGFKEER